MFWGEMPNVAAYRRGREIGWEGMGMSTTMVADWDQEGRRRRRRSGVARGDGGGFILQVARRWWWW
jgi:hypothetical protein